VDDRDWKIIKVLFQEKNITKTAESLFISQPTLTKRLQQIETEWGVQIVERGRRGVQFTPQGEYLSRCAEEMLAKIREMKDTISNMDDEVSGTLRLGVSNYFTRYKLAGILRLFKNHYPSPFSRIMLSFIF
jgi:DNA-binding transcriptional LysR family regulator